MKRLLFTLSLLITLSWSSALSAQTDCLSLRPDHAAATSGETVCIDVKVENFKDVLGMQFSLRWDPAVLSYLEVTNLSLPDLSQASFGTPINSPAFQDRIRVFWIDNSITPRSLEDGASLFTVCFKVNGAAGSYSPILFDTSPTDIEFGVGTSAASHETVPATLFSGSVSVSNTIPDLPQISLDYCPVLTSCSEVPPQGIAPIVTGGTLPYAYSWTGPADFTSLEAAVAEPLAGSYTLNVTDAEGVSTFVTYDVVTVDDNAPSLTNISIIQPESCDENGKGSINFTVENGSGEYEYLWSDGATTQNRGNLSSGIYTVTVTDLFLGCSISHPFTILPDSGDPIYRYDKIIDVSCGTTNTGSIELSVGGEYDGTTVVWNTGATGSKISNLAPGLYSATVTTATGCSFEWQGEVEASGSIEFSGTVGYEDCGVESGYINLELPGDPADYNYFWETGAATKDISGLEAGVYEVTVTHLSNGCIGTEKFEVWDGELLTASNYECIVEGQTLFTKITAVVWDGGAPPYTFSWSNGETQVDDFLSSTIISQPGSITVTVTDSKGCSDVLAPITPECNGETGNTEFSTASGYNCIEDENGEQSQAEITYTVWDGGTPPYTFTWSNSTTEVDAQKSSIIAPADAVTFYEVTVTDQNGLTHVSGKIRPVCQIDGNPLVLDIGEGSVNQSGEPVCLPLRVEGFTAINGIQFTMSWDPTQLAADSLVNIGLPTFTSSNYSLSPLGGSENMGLMTVAWFDPNTQGVTLPDGTTLFEVCFTTIGDEETIEVVLSNEPTLIEAVNAASQVLPVTTQSGWVSILGENDKVVWPGDTDNNGLVDHFDLLNIGLAFGAEGYPRPDAGLNWEAQFGAPWSQATPNTQIDYRHIDTDGNGTITANDTLALALNYRLFNEFWDGEEGFTERDNLPESARTTGTPLYVDTYPVAEGTMPVFDVILGDDTNTNNTVYGTAFSIDYDPQAIVPGSIKMSFTDSWLGEVGKDLLTFYRVDSQNHKVHVAITRTDGKDITGSGAIAQLLITIEDVIFRSNNYEIPISIENARLITSREELVSVVEQSSVITVETTTNTIDALLDRQIKVYPIPAQDELFLMAPHLRIEAIELYDLEGRRLQRWNGHPNRLSLNDLAPGTYALRLITDQGVAVRRVVIMN